MESSYNLYILCSIKDEICWLSSKILISHEGIFPSGQSFDLVLALGNIVKVNLSYLTVRV